MAAFVKDLMEEDEDEAEVPVRAYRRPVVLAAAVQSECAWMGYVLCACVSSMPACR